MEYKYVDKIKKNKIQMINALMVQFCKVQLVYFYDCMHLIESCALHSAQIVNTVLRVLYILLMKFCTP